MTSGIATTMIHAAGNTAPFFTSSTNVDGVEVHIQREARITGTFHSRTHLQ